MARAVVTLESGGLPVVDMAGSGTPDLGIAVEEAHNGFGLGVTKVGSHGMAVVYIAPPLAVAPEFVDHNYFITNTYAASQSRTVGVNGIDAGLDAVLVAACAERAINGVSDSKGNAWTLDGAVAANNRLAVWRSTLTTRLEADDTITVDLAGASQDFYLWLIAGSGLTEKPKDFVEDSGSGSTTANMQTAMLTGGAAILAVAASGGYNDIQTATGWTEQHYAVTAGSGLFVRSWTRQEPNGGQFLFDPRFNAAWSAVVCSYGF